MINEEENENQQQERSTVRSKLRSLIASLGIINDEKEHMRDVLKSLKLDHGVSPKLARKAAKEIFIDYNSIKDDKEREEIERLKTIANIKPE